MIGNVFYNLLNHVALDKSDPKLLELSAQVKEMMQVRRFDNLMGLKVPHLKHGVMNLLKVVDLSPEDQIELIKMGYGDILRNPSVQTRSSDQNKNRYDLQLEASDEFRACTVSFKFCTFKTSVHANPMTLPRRLFFQVRFFTFPEVHTDTVEVFEPGMGDMAIIKPGGTYYLRKDRIVDLGRGRVQRMQVDSLADQEMLSITYDIDPTVSKVENENMMLAQYMKE